MSKDNKDLMEITESLIELQERTEKVNEGITELREKTDESLTMLNDLSAMLKETYERLEKLQKDRNSGKGRY